MSIACSRPIGVAAAILLALNGPARAADPAACEIEGDVKSAEWRSRCDAAISAETEPRRKAALLFGRAYAAVEQYQYDAALQDLSDALVADPDNARYLHERAYINGELSNYSAAIRDLDRQVELQPTAATAFRERAYARHFSGDLTGAYADRSRELELSPDSPAALLGRAEAALWLGRFDDATADARRAASLANKAADGEASAAAAKLLAEIKRWRDLPPGADKKVVCEMQAMDKSTPQRLIGRCTRTFLEAKSGSAKADALTVRSTAWLVVAGDEGNATEDKRMAVALDPGNIDRHINLGYAYLTSRHSWAARREFDAALAIETHWMALAGRAAARLNLGDREGALTDAQASMELHPSEASAWVLAELAFDAGDRDSARALYLQIYRGGSRSDELIARLKELGVPDPDKAPVK